MQRTIRIKLQPTTEQTTALLETRRQFTDVFNAVAAYGWQQRIKNGVTLHHALYYPLKAQYPDLVSDLHIQARVKATEAVASALQLAKDPERTVTQPRSWGCAPRYNVHTYKVDWQAQIVNLATVAGRQRIPFVVPDYARQYIGCETDSADLLLRDGDWWLHIVVTVPAPDVQPSDMVIGVDLGLAQPAVTSNRQFLGKRRWKAIEGRYFYLRRQLQKRGTKSAKRHLRRIRHKHARYRRDCDHVLSKQIVQAAPEGSMIVVENLTHIRQRTKQRGTDTRQRMQRRRMHSWSYHQLRQFLMYKAAARGCMVVAVDPRHTSQQCSRCGHQDRNNRRARADFWCRACGYRLHADLNAAKNIAAKYHASVGTSDVGGLSVTQPIAPVFHPSGVRLGASCLLL
ncbi:MAG: transposase [Chloroflexota bacterium]|nr:transposase [Chloroflexota bacterium]